MYTIMCDLRLYPPFVFSVCIKGAWHTIYHARPLTSAEHWPNTGGCGWSLSHHCANGTALSVWTNVRLTLVQRLRRWTSVKRTLFQCVVFAGMCPESRPGRMNKTRLRGKTSQQIWQVHPRLGYCWPTVYSAWPTLAQHWVNVSCLLGCHHDDVVTAGGGRDADA